MEVIDEIREIIISEAQKFIKKHKIKFKEPDSIDDPRHVNHDIYAGLDGKKSGDWFNIDDCFTSEVY